MTIRLPETAPCWNAASAFVAFAAASARRLRIFSTSSNRALSSSARRRTSLPSSRPPRWYAYFPTVALLYEQSWPMSPLTRHARSTTCSAP